jgi:large subunit ribosomal protein L44e
MKFPKETKRLCPTCKKHTGHKIKQEKNRGKNKTHPMSAGSRSRMQERGLDRGIGNHGKTSKGAIGSWKRWNKKRTKKTDFRYTCNECKKTHTQGSGLRVGKIVFE